MTPLEKALALKAAPLFAPLPADQLLPIGRLCSTVDLEAEEVRFEAGDLGDALYVVVRGRVRVAGDRGVLARLGPGECVGEMAALDWEPRSATVIADEPSRLVRLERNDLIDLVAEEPELVRSLAGVLASRIRNMRT